MHVSICHDKVQVSQMTQVVLACYTTQVLLLMDVHLPALGHQGQAPVEVCNAPQAEPACCAIGCLLLYLLLLPGLLHVQLQCEVSWTQGMRAKARDPNGAAPMVLTQ